MIRWVLVVHQGGRSVRRPLVDGEQLAGSAAEADVLLDHPTVSRRHAVLRPTPTGVEITDLGSSNGTFVDGKRIGGQRTVGDALPVHFGSLACAFETEAQDETEAAIHLDTAPRDTASRDTESRDTTTRDTESRDTTTRDTESRDTESRDTASRDTTTRDTESRDTASRDTVSRPFEAVGSDEDPLPQTFSVGSTREFVAEALPQVVSALEAAHRAAVDRRPVLAGATVQVAGQTFFRAFPCRSLEILRVDGPEPAVLFRAGEFADPDRQDWTAHRAGPLMTRVLFTPGLHTAGIEPLVALVTRLAALALPEMSETRDPRPVPAPPALPEPATVDPGMQRLYVEATRIARGDVSVLIGGETGTGKEVLARFIHRVSPRAKRPWLAINCAALPEDLLEAELFGIEKGVATGVEARPGRFEQADGGTLFLDEIGDMSPSTQAKILRVLQEGEVYRLGARSPRPARARILAATNRDLATMLDDGTFRLDLFHRIADCRLTLPPLRHRSADLPSLAAHFLTRAAADAGVQVRGISRAALDALVAYPWPGNVRQLEREMIRAVLFLEDGELLQTRHLHAEVAGAPRPDPALDGQSLKARLEAVERRILIDALARHDGNVRAAAEELRVGRTTFYRRLSELSIET